MSKKSVLKSPSNLGFISRLEKIVHNEIEVVVMDFENCSRDQEIRLQEEMNELLEKSPEKSVLLLNNLASHQYDPHLTNSWQLLANLFERKLKKSAIYGASPFTKISIAGYLQGCAIFFGITRNNRGQIFTSREEALDWLTK